MVCSATSVVSGAVFRDSAGYIASFMEASLEPGIQPAQS